jgi:hypothetical protein
MMAVNALLTVATGLLAIWFALKIVRAQRFEMLSEIVGNYQIELAGMHSHSCTLKHTLMQKLMHTLVNKLVVCVSVDLWVID